ncbi:hypothetical protein HWV62_34773 [Athelia sp. TMB]|nr:hypothetical protein HWV62_34773 [Athelia sp. TMB]
MADLHLGYLKGADSEHALFDRIAKLLRTIQLEKHDLVDRGLDSKNPTRPRFTIRPELLKQAEDVIISLQTLLDAAFSLLQPDPANALYVVDPESMMLFTLKGSNSFFELSRAWEVITTRVAKGQQVFEKYVYVFQGKLANLASPSNTDPAVYESLKKEDLTFDDVVDKLYQGVPGLRARLQPEQASRLDGGEPLRSLLQSPIHLKEVFSPREPNLHHQKDTTTKKGRGIPIGRTVYRKWIKKSLSNKRTNVELE